MTKNILNLEETLVTDFKRSSKQKIYKKIRGMSNCLNLNLKRKFFIVAKEGMGSGEGTLHTGE